MASTRLLGSLAVLSIAVLVVGSLWRLLQLATGDDVAAAGATLAIVVVLTVAGVLAGRRSGGWTANPYW
ncbi:hypothetical protein [Halomarina rubra]|uniref:Uncharacterized protein n=1 Tax=Halomarina rubra TaxID=2071873 RepID=A0ABD6B0A2_9EURY|nr:hypothetical protein [Halomarina rubra]